MRFFNIRRDKSLPIALDTTPELSEQPTSNFFAPTVTDILGKYLADEGLELIDSSESRLTYRKGMSVLEVSYSVNGPFIESVPRYLNFVVGRVTSGRPYGTIALWRIIPEESPEYKQSTATFSNATELATALEKCIPVVLPTYGRRLMEDDSVYASALAQQALESEREHSKHVESQILNVARRAFDQGNYALARDNWVLFGTDRLSAADQRRLYQARKRLKEEDTSDD